VQKIMVSWKTNWKFRYDY